MTLEPTPLPITGTPKNAASLAQYDHWTQETLNNSNPPVWVADSPAGMTVEPTPLPITGTPKNAANLA